MGTVGRFTATWIILQGISLICARWHLTPWTCLTSLTGVFLPLFGCTCQGTPSHISRPGCRYLHKISDFPQPSRPLRSLFWEEKMRKHSNRFKHPVIICEMCLLLKLLKFCWNCRHALMGPLMVWRGSLERTWPSSSTNEPRNNGILKYQTSMKPK